MNTTEVQWWQAPEDTTEEYHTAHYWEQIAKAARKAGDIARAEQAEQASEFESRLAGN